MLDTQEHIDFEASLTLEKLRVGVSRVLSVDVAEETELAVWRDVMVDGLVFDLKTHVWAEKLAEREHTVVFDESASFPFPASPWQFAKQRIRGWKRTPRWVCRVLGPVDLRYAHKSVRATRTVVLQQFATFPAAAIKTPPQIHRNRIFRYEQAVERG